MKRLLLLCLLTLVTSALAARQRSAASRINSGDPHLESLLLHVNHNVEWFLSEGVGKLDLTVNVHASSQSQNQRWWTPLVQDLLPFDTRPNRTTELDALCKVSYQTPCDLLVTPLTLSSDNRRRSRRVLRQLYQILIPIYDLKLMRDKGDDKEYVLPFSTDGLKRYTYQVKDTLIAGLDTTLVISFTPNIKHHDLLEGEADIDLRLQIPTELRMQGLVDFGKMKDTIRFDITHGYWMPHSSSVDLEYKYGKTRGLNHYDYTFNVRQLLPRKAFDPRLEPLDLSHIYQPQPSDFINTDTLPRTPDTTAHRSARRKALYKLPQRMVSSTTFEGTHSDFRIYGPLNPSFIGYDKINGITFRQRLRYNFLLDNEQGVRLLAEAGYASKLQAFRYRFNTEWIYCPRRRGSLTLKLQNGTTGFSSRFKDDVNDAIKRYSESLQATKNPNLHKNTSWLHREDQLSFDSLGLQYFNKYQFVLENTIELATGLRLYVGADYSIRRPVKRGVRASIQQVTNRTIDDRYLDMNPYLQLIWTPRQYYYYDNNHKLYLNSLWPTFAFQISKGVKNVLKSRANYCSLEFDAQQQIDFGRSRILSWHSGCGGFFKQKEEYFVNYTYFSRSQYPSTWDKRATGGAFALLDDYWYSSSPSYAQSHIMYQSPFLFLHRLRFISKYVIKERVYASALFAQGKNAYGELGYGIGNNYFNVAMFAGFMGDKPFDFGVKFSFELDHHL